MSKDFLKVFYIACLALITLLPAAASAGGVSPYVPLNKSPEIERQIERVMILAGRPVMTRPIPVALVIEALHDAREKDEELCAQVEQYLLRYMHETGLTQLRAELALDAGDSQQVLPNQYGKTVESSWQVSGEFFYKPSEYALINLGGIAYDGHATPTGSMLSVGMDYAQLDIGYREHWLSPFTDSSMLLSTEATTMPSVTLSNLRPITGLGIYYQIYLAEMSESDHILYQNRYTSGKPRLGGMHLQVQPADGYSFSVNRQLQYGGGERPNDSFSDFMDAFVDYSEYDTMQSPLDFDKEFGNQEASLTSRIIFPGRRPFSVYFEYAGEDSSSFGSYKLGCAAFSVGIDIPVLWDRFDLVYEATERQNNWYVSHIYHDGMINDGNVVGHWFGDQRIFNDDAGGSSQMLRLGWQLENGDYMSAVYRTLNNDSYTTIDYKRMHQIGLRYSHPWNGQLIGLQLVSGRDVFGEWYASLSASLDYKQDWSAISAGTGSSAEDSRDLTDLFVDGGVSYNKLRTNRIYMQDGTFRRRTADGTDVHLGFGARRSVTEHSDLGARIEYDRAGGDELFSLRMLDYRYRLGARFAFSGFFGVGRYNLDTPAYGYYFGFGPQMLNIMPKWDLCVDFSDRQDMARRRSKESDPPPENLQYDVRGVTIYLSRRF